jgi:hypothetical protein
MPEPVAAPSDTLAPSIGVPSTVTTVPARRAVWALVGWPATRRISVAIASLAAMV